MPKMFCTIWLDNKGERARQTVEKIKDFVKENKEVIVKFWVGKGKKIKHIEIETIDILAGYIDALAGVLSKICSDHDKSTKVVTSQT